MLVSLSVCNLTSLQLCLLLRLCPFEFRKTSLLTLCLSLFYVLVLRSYDLRRLSTLVRGGERGGEVVRRLAQDAGGRVARVARVQPRLGAALGSGLGSGSG